MTHYSSPTHLISTFYNVLIGILLSYTSNFHGFTYVRMYDAIQVNTVLDIVPIITQYNTLIANMHMAHSHCTINSGCSEMEINID